MTPYRIEVTHQYLKDVKRASKRNLDISKLNYIVEMLIYDIPLPPHNKDHNLIGDYRGCRECHISPDWLLIYRKDTTLELISLIRTGSHSDLF
ncbi:MAG: type II toxin-antitoxin system YafQ family toxin [Muribaculaceae bacterium]|nr:type II toxin-antitoxin system YafQ family toxin [Muribaculaceae bacterium]